MTGSNDHELPRNVLIISAEMGEGHNAAAAALTEAIKECWPGCELNQFDTMELRGPRFARVARWSYGFQLNVWPWSYEAFYSVLSRSQGFADRSRSVVGAFFGPRFEKSMRGLRPDIVISTYPFGSGALDWLRRKRGLDALTVTYIPAFHVHPLWAYNGVDLHFVMYDSAADHALLPGLESSLRVGAPPVRKGFGEVGREEARERLGLGAEEFVVLVTGGAWGLGAIADGVESLVHLGGPPLHVVAVCGKNAQLEARARALEDVGPDRLTVFGYIDNMPEMMAAADVVVTNGAGVTVLEALRTPRPVVAFAPLAGHGIASTKEMVGRHLAVEARTVAELTAQVRRLRTDQEWLRTMERAGEEWVRGRDLRKSVREIEAAWAARRHGEADLTGLDGAPISLDGVQIPSTPPASAPTTSGPAVAATTEAPTPEAAAGTPVAGAPVAGAPVAGAPVAGTPDFGTPPGAYAGKG
jgi:UDP-N-acetylglucosamine:LPS N-acetylglucosamine transferase